MEGPRIAPRGRKRRLALACLAVCIVLTARAPKVRAEERVLEIGKWYPSVEAGVNLTQSSYSNNWAGGDRGSIVWTAILNSSLESQLHTKVNWLQTLKLSYGQTHQQRVAASGERAWDRPDKSTDLFDYEDVLRFTLGAFVDPFVSGRFESQFQDASDPTGRTLALNPMKFKESAGVARQFINEKERNLLSRLGFTLRQNVRKVFENPAPDDATRSETTNDGGIELVTDYKTKALKDRVAWTSKLAFYQPLYFSGTDELEDVPSEQLAAAGIDPDMADFATTLDADWENIFTTQITKLIAVSLYTRWVYDKYDNSVLPVMNASGDLTNADALRRAIRKSGQFKQTLSLGITYRFL